MRVTGADVPQRFLEVNRENKGADPKGSFFLLADRDKNQGYNRKLLPYPFMKVS